MNAIELSHIQKSFGGFAIQDLSLTVPSGTICGLVGENGAGKSTTIRLALGALRPDGGSAAVLGTDVSSPAFTGVKEDVGVVLDEAYFPETLNALQVGRILASTYRQWEQGTYESYLSRFGLPEKKQFKDFSRGMKMKLAIAAALSHRPRLLVLDEATSGLDPMVRDELLDVFADFAVEDGHAVLLSSHIVSDLEKICDYIAFLHKGRLVLCEEKDALLDRYGILKCTKEQIKNVPSEAVHSMRLGPYGAEALVERAFMPKDLLVERATLEDIILYLSKEEDQ